MMYALCQQFLHLLIEGDEFYTKDETLSLKWHREGGQQSFASSQIKARSNAGNFYRNFVWKTISEPGSYEIRLYDRNEQLIARQAFKII